MSSNDHTLPEVGDPAPFFQVETAKGLVSFPDYSEGCWCVFFAHPANFTSAWWMYSTFLALKERWFNARNTKLLTLSNEPVRHNDWSDKVRRYIGIYLKAPIIEDLDFSIAHRFGMASVRRKTPGHDRLAFIIDPEGIIRVIIRVPLPSIEDAIVDLQFELDRLQGNLHAGCVEQPQLQPLEISEQLDVPVSDTYKPKPAYFKKKTVNPN